jgi:hypothetical protein
MTRLKAKYPLRPGQMARPATGAGLGSHDVWARCPRRRVRRRPDGPPARSEGLGHNRLDGAFPEPVAGHRVSRRGGLVTCARRDNGPRVREMSWAVRLRSCGCSSAASIQAKRSDGRSVALKHRTGGGRAGSSAGSAGVSAPIPPIPWLHDMLCQPASLGASAALGWDDQSRASRIRTSVRAICSLARSAAMAPRAQRFARPVWRRWSMRAIRSRPLHPICWTPKLSSTGKSAGLFRCNTFWSAPTGCDRGRPWHPMQRRRPVAARSRHPPPGETTRHSLGIA